VLRSHYAAHVGTDDYEELISELSAKSDLFLKLWNERETQPPVTIDISLEHPKWSSLKFYSARTTPDDGSANAIYLLPPANAAPERAMRRTSKEA
jgi:hypothetical protein